LIAKERNLSNLNWRDDGDDDKKVVDVNKGRHAMSLLPYDVVRRRLRLFIAASKLTANQDILVASH
jgi:hypothetical protein